MREAKYTGYLWLEYIADSNCGRELDGNISKKNIFEDAN